MASIAAEKYITPEAYIAEERRAKIKSEYIYGEIFAMSGASNAHNLIANCHSGIYIPVFHIRIDNRIYST